MASVFSFLKIDCQIRPTPSTMSNDSNVLERKFARLQDLVGYLLHRRQAASLKSRQSTRIKPKCIPAFEPGNPNLTSRKWICTIKQLVRINSNLDEEAKILHMQNRYDGLAKRWYENLDSFNRTG